MTARRAILVCLGLLALVAAGSVARAESAKAAAAAHLVRGSRLYDQGRFDEAIAELKAGYALDARPDFLYALGQAERKRGDCKAAIGWYQRYVDSGLSTQRTVATLMQIDRCKQELASATTSRPPPPSPSPSTETPSPPGATTPPPTTAPSAEEPPTSAPPPVAAAPTAPARDSAPGATTPIYKRWWLWTIVAVVVAGGVGTGIAVAVTQRSTFDSTLPDLTWGQSALGVRF